MKNKLIQVNSYGMGHGDETLGLKLVGNYFRLLIQEEKLPSIITFYNAGVKLICEGSPVINILQEIENKGVKLLACKTCLDYYDLIDKRKVGIEGTMIDIISLQSAAEQVINV